MAEKKSKESVLFVKSAIREFIKGKDLNTSKEVLDEGALNTVIITILENACKRAIGNGRKTVKARDF